MSPVNESNATENEDSSAKQPKNIPFLPKYVFKSQRLNGTSGNLATSAPHSAEGKKKDKGGKLGTYIGQRGKRGGGSQRGNVK